jgi:hypothetical protein
MRYINTQGSQYNTIRSNGSNQDTLMVASSGSNHLKEPGVVAGNTAVQREDNRTCKPRFKILCDDERVGRLPFSRGRASFAGASSQTRVSQRLW